MESLNLTIQSKQSKLNFLSCMEWMVRRVLKEIADLAVEVGGSLRLGRLLEKWGGELRKVLRLFPRLCAIL